MTPKNCPECGRSVSWRNTALRCLGCGREYCKECPDYTLGRFDVGCPDCGCGSARPLVLMDDAGRSAPPIDRDRTNGGGGRNLRRWRPPRPFRPGPGRGRRPPRKDIRDDSAQRDLSDDSGQGDAPDDPPAGSSSPFSF